MSSLLRWPLPAILISSVLPLFAFGQPSSSTPAIRMPAYSVELKPGDPPRLQIARDGETVFEVPAVSGLSSDTSEEQLSAIEFSVRQAGERRLGN